MMILRTGGGSRRGVFESTDKGQQNSLKAADLEISGISSFAVNKLQSSLDSCCRRGHRAGREAKRFRSGSPVPQIKCYLATDEKCAKGDFPCILLGLGAHGDPLVARAKALDEYSTMYYDHLYRPGWCEFLECSPSKIGRITDFHHVQSRDPRNREIFKQLCTVGKDHQLSSARSTDVSKAWTYRHLESPVRFIRYVQASNPKITALSFGVPEPGSSNNQERPLFHPIW
jgi:hypothetical protein